MPFLTLQFLPSPPRPRHTHTYADKAQSLMLYQSVPTLKHCQSLTHPFASSLICCDLSQNIGLRKSHFFFFPPIGNSIISRSFLPCEIRHHPQTSVISHPSTHIPTSRLNFLCCGCCLQQWSVQFLQRLERFSQIGCCSAPSPPRLSLLSHEPESKQAARRHGNVPNYLICSHLSLLKKAGSSELFVSRFLFCCKISPPQTNKSYRKIQSQYFETDCR